MPLPKRYAGQVPDLEQIWSPEGYFTTQLSIWLAQVEARHELYDEPTKKQLAEIKKALTLSDKDIQQLLVAKGHETNTLLRLIQAKLPSEIGNFIHKGNTSSDVLDTSLALQIGKSLTIIKNDFIALSASLKKLALEHKATLQIGRTHGQHAMPQTFGRQVLGWYAEVARGIERIDRAMSVIAFGKCSGEIGTHVFLAPELEERSLAKLGLRPDPAPTQVISRDRHAEVVGLLAVNSATLARIATNIRLLSITEVGEVREPFDAASQQGSSAMPHKRNSELTERIVGLNRRIRGTVCEELDAALLWLERDMSQSSTERYTFPDLFGNLVYATRLMTQVIDGLVVYKDRMLANLDATYGAIYSPRLLNTLLESGEMSRTEAYELVKGLAQEAMDTRVQLRELAGANKQLVSLLGKDQLAELFDPEFYLRNIDTAYKRLGL